MQLIFDNLIATFVAMTLAVTLLGQQNLNRQQSLERVAVYAAKTQSLGFAEWLEDDVVKLGARFGRSRDRFQTTTVERDGVDFTDAFTYYYNESTVTANVVDRAEVQYVLSPDDTRRVVAQKGATTADDVVIPVYTLVRSERKGRYNTATGEWLSPHDPVDGPDWAVTPGYQSPVGLRHFLIQPLDSDQQKVRGAEAEKADYARVQFSVVPTLFPLHRARLVPKNGLHWATTVEIRPF